MATKKRTAKISTQIFALICCCTAFFSLLINAEGANITAFGDSITEGTGSNTGGYPPRLQNLLNGNSKPSTVSNFGSYGETTQGGVDRFDSVLASFAANIILIMEGTNDVHTGISIETTKYNLETMVNKAKAAKATPVLSTLTPSDRGDSATLIPQAWNPMIKSLADRNGIKLADNYAAAAPNWGALNDDGIHPNDNGYQTIANTWYTTIASMISSTGTTNSVKAGGGGDGGGCFIATAAFGSPIEKHVMLLKEFRDSFLLNNLPGRQFVKTYYILSPPVAEFIREHDTVRYVVRVLLYPLVAFSYVMLRLFSFPAYFFALVAMITCVLAFSALIVRRHAKSEKAAHKPT